MWGKKAARPQKHYQTCSLHRTGTSLIAFCRELPGALPHGFGWLPVKIPWKIFPHCLGVEGARPRARHLHDSRAAPFPFLPGTQLSCSGQLCSVPREGEKGKNQSVDDKSSEDQKLFSFGEEFFREKSASAGGRKDITRPFHTVHAGPWFPGASRREPGLRGPEGPKDLTERKRDH